MKNSTLKALLIILVIILAGFSIFFADKYPTSGLQVSAQTDSLNNNSDMNNIIILYEFYGEGCPRCTELNSFLEEHKKSYPNLKINRYEKC